MLKRAGRRLLVSPWFAAGAGFVIATGAVIYVPHAKLDPAINVTHCKNASCKQRQFTPQGGPPPLPAGINGGRVTPSPSPPSVPAGMTFQYQLLSNSTQYGFSMLITVRARQDPGPWKLSFAIRGARHVYVYGAPWQPYDANGVTVSSPIAGTESAGYAVISAHESGGEIGSSPSGYTVQFQVRGTGTPSGPSSCAYNRATCTFQPSPVLAPPSLPGSG